MDMQTILLFAIFLLYFLAITIFAYILIFKPADDTSRNDKKSSLTAEEREKLKTEEFKPEAEKNAVEVREEEEKEKKSGLSSRLGSLAPAGYANYIRKTLQYSGSPSNISLDRIMTLKISLAIIAALILILFAAAITSGSLAVLLIIAAALIAFFAPDAWISNKANKRQKELDQSLPDSLDLLTISVEAGLGFDAAIKRVVENTTGPLSEELFRLLQEIQLGISRIQAFRNLIARTRAPELRYLITTIIQADAYGISIAKVLRSQSKELKVRRHQRAEEAAIKAPVKVLFPLILCIFPALLIVVFGPAGIRIMSTLSDIGK